MAHQNDRRIWWAILPLTAAVFFALATWLYRLPDRRFAQAEAAFQAGDYPRTMALLAGEASKRADDLRDRVRLKQAQAALAAGDEKEVRALLALLPPSPETRAMEQELSYAQALRLLKSGAYPQAMEAFLALGSFRDSLDRVDQIRIALAEEQYRRGEGAQAVEAFLAIGGQENRQRALEIARELTGLTDAEAALQRVRGLTPQEVERLRLVAQGQEQTRRRRLAAGFHHTVGLRADGTVLAAGDDSSGQCAVSAWAEVIEVAAGARHTVGLRADGTVLAAGDDSFGQCEVSAWKNVVQIAAGNYDTFGLTADGAILHAGFGDYAMAANWPGDLVWIEAGGYALCALRENGTLLASHPSVAAPEATELKRAAVQPGYGLGLREDGAVLCWGIELPSWTDGIALYAGADRVLVLQVGNVLEEAAFLDRDRLLPGPLEGVKAAATGATFVAVLREDGTVACFGEDEWGACDTGGWDLDP